MINIAMTEMKRLHALIPKELYDWIKEYGDENGVSLAESIRIALSDFHYRHNKAEFFKGREFPDPGYLLGRPKEDEDSDESLRERLYKLEIAVHLIYHRPGSRSDVPPPEIADVIPNYMRL